MTQRIQFTTDRARINLALYILTYNWDAWRLHQQSPEIGWPPGELRCLPTFSTHPDAAERFPELMWESEGDVKEVRCA